jgi:hypothetical protein
MPMPPGPTGVEIAAMVSFSRRRLMVQTQDKREYGIPLCRLIAEAQAGWLFEAGYG